MCSDKLVSSRKNTAWARPTSRYWMGWMRRFLSCSNTKKAAKLSTMNRKPYFTDRVAVLYGSRAGQEVATKAGMRPVAAQVGGHHITYRHKAEGAGAHQAHRDGERQGLGASIQGHIVGHTMKTAGEVFDIARS